MKTLIIIPAFNERDNIANLVNDIKSFGYDYLIINDHSTDDTSLIAKGNGFNILDLSVNVGLAGVTRVGFKYAYDNNYDCVICIDGDGQHQPKYVQSVIKEIENGYDYSIGSRFVTEKKPLSMRMLGSRILSFLIKIKTGKTINDPTSGMRALGKKVIKDFAESMNFHAEPDAVCYLLKRGYKVKEVQVEMLDRQAGTSYFVSPFKSIKFMFSQIVSILFIQW
ncbi:MAG: glycosyltransferase family 2 protein [Erysipelotrichaceae bacterium]|nr:glycosyltransferase family 2 protein [Erysipelotrichaceae bacterium]